MDAISRGALVVWLFVLDVRNAQLHLIHHLAIRKLNTRRQQQQQQINASNLAVNANRSPPPKSPDQALPIASRINKTRAASNGPHPSLDRFARAAPSPSDRFAS
ncbi:hypothetical protein HDK64DRAFT_276112 [Phyllosticta capitalensis]